MRNVNHESLQYNQVSKDFQNFTHFFKFYPIFKIFLKFQITKFYPIFKFYQISELCQIYFSISLLPWRMACQDQCSWGLTIPIKWRKYTNLHNLYLLFFRNGAMKTFCKPFFIPISNRKCNRKVVPSINAFCNL